VYFTLAALANVPQMPLDEPKARAILRALLDAAGGQVANFVPIRDILPASDPHALSTLNELVQLRWIRHRDGQIAATKWAIEFAMDWTHIPTLLRAVVNSAGGIGRSANLDVVITASGLEDHLVKALLSELTMLGLAGFTGCKQEDGNWTLGAYVTITGWDLLTTGAYTPRDDHSDPLSPT
jgi:hypothetical protein